MGLRVDWSQQRHVEIGQTRQIDQGDRRRRGIGGDGMRILNICAYFRGTYAQLGTSVREDSTSFVVPVPSAMDCARSLFVIVIEDAFLLE